MMKSFGKVLVVLLVLGVFGWLRMPVEQRLSNELKEAHIISPSFDMEARAGLNQKGFVASFGSFRPTLAAFVALTSNKYHVGGDWNKLEESFETAVLLDPYNPYYWDVGGWHMAYNAAGAERENKQLSPLARQRAFKSYIEKGSNFLDRGIAANPQDLSLRMAKSRLWANNQRIINFEIVEKTLREVLDEVELSDLQRAQVERDLFHALIRMPENAQEAYELGREIYSKYPEDRYPSLVNGLCALQMHPRVDVDEPISLPDLYGNRQNAIRLLENYQKDQDPYKPKYGIAELIEEMKAVDAE